MRLHLLATVGLVGLPAVGEQPTLAHQGICFPSPLVEWLLAQLSGCQLRSELEGRSLEVRSSARFLECAAHTNLYDILDRCATATSDG